MSAKKPAARTKEKASHPAETAAVTRKRVPGKRPASGCPARGCPTNGHSASGHSTNGHLGRGSLAENKEADKESDPVMDVRTNKDRRHSDRRETAAPVELDRRTGQRRAKVNRRRQIDPTTCERDYSPEEIEFMSTLDDYKRRSGRMFPTCSEILEVIKGLGYERRAEVATVTLTTEPAPIAEATAEQAV